MRDLRRTAATPRGHRRGIELFRRRRVAFEHVDLEAFCLHCEGARKARNAGAYDDDLGHWSAPPADQSAGTRAGVLIVLARDFAVHHGCEIAGTVLQKTLAAGR